jgi:ketosteroid isomerase-like protein
MSLEDVNRARRAYSALNDAYRTGEFRAVIEEHFDPEIVFKPAGIMPEGSGEVRGYDELVNFTVRQAEAFEDLSLKPERFIDAGDRVVVPLSLTGRARHSGLPIEISFVHTGTYRDGKAVKVEVHETMQDALEAAGVR